MLKVTADAFHEKLNTDNEEIILNGPPSNLRGHIFLRNASDEQLSVKTLSVVHNEKNILGDSSTLRIGSRLKPGEEKMESIWHELPPQTPPGTYESKLVIGGTERKIKMIVQPHMHVSIHPVNFSFIGSEPGKTHTAQITITNTGNLPFQIPDVKHIAALDMDLICRAVGVALRGKGGEGYISTMDEIAKNVNRNLPDWASAHIEENGQTLAAGATMIVHLNITLPNNTDSSRDYNGNMRFWNKQITYEIKSQSEQIK
ncbi:MAG: hypothetical protein ABJB05_03190 [Parafilimonas sp.]